MRPVVAEISFQRTPAVLTKSSIQIHKAAAMGWLTIMQPMRVVMDMYVLESLVFASLLPVELSVVRVIHPAFMQPLMMIPNPLLQELVMMELLLPFQRLFVPMQKSMFIKLVDAVKVLRLPEMHGKGINFKACVRGRTHKTPFNSCKIF